ncbi:MAG: Protein gvpK [Candidatus Magnetoglobus multicellularis str. Araruama]|uniref:Protein gvpK n=1 Tax=Candidatus Magnetoglobus multicellularis str. Araruama TaxID=890399 RepID=A0A1V1PBA1_9BACT|nr:MAG: Protein gvpK [Candidatus Magnetoglobus multicellularis str. Araruama]
MSNIEDLTTAHVASNHLSDFAKIMNTGRRTSENQPAASNQPKEGISLNKGKLNLNQDDVKNGLGQLVLALVNLLHELLERQAIRRIDGDSLTDEEIENIGLALMQQSEEIERLRKEFNLEEEDLNLDLGPLGRLL